MITEGKKCLPPSLITLPPHRVGKKNVCASWTTLSPLANQYSPPLVGEGGGGEGVEELGVLYDCF